MNTAIFYQLLVVGNLAFWALIVGLILRWLRRGTPNGAHLAEVWLEWEICTGSTLYRARFNRRWQAALAAKWHAVLLDWTLPTHYRAEYSNGRPYLEPYGFSLQWGVRAPTNSPQDSAAIWSPVMPGSQASTSEHREAHPWNQDGPLAFKGDLTGFKL